ncbi:MAG: M67 family metallopeptidase, partial [Acidobacteriota bacterium]|nr:M67 family metallopeptidase [Acidobacteriota bacterium]
MRRRRLLLSAAHRRLLVAAARGAAPEECCGILVGRRSAGAAVVTRVVAGENAGLRDRERRYEIDPRLLLAAWRAARAAGEDVVGFYHSHPGGRCRPSAGDAAAALPGMSYVIVAPGRRAWETASWHGRRGAGL